MSKHGDYHRPRRCLPKSLARPITKSGDPPTEGQVGNNKIIIYGTYSHLKVQATCYLYMPGMTTRSKWNNQIGYYNIYGRNKVAAVSRSSLAKGRTPL